MFLSKMLKIFSVVLIAVSVGSAGNHQSGKSGTEKKKHYVDNVKQNYDVDVNKLIEEQIGRELAASYVYQAYASYFQRADVNLPGIQKFFTDASAEEKQHAQMLIDYVNKRGGHATFDDINLINTCMEVKRNDASNYYVDGDKKTRMCICSFVWPKEIHDFCPAERSDWKNGLYAFEDALALERYVNEQLILLHQAADEAGDAQLTHFLEHEFLTEQVQAINQLGHYVTRLRSFAGDSYSLGEYLFDQKLT